MSPSDTRPARLDQNVKLGVIITLGLVYVIWGSTYLGIRFADESIPPLLMGGVRFLIAGTLLYIWSRARGAQNPTRRQWKTSAIVGLCLLAGGNGAVIVVEKQVPSGIAALLVALVPLWMVVLLWLRRSGQNPTLRTVFGVILGLVGVAVLALHGGGNGGQGINPLAFVLILSSGLWAWGSLYAQRAEQSPSPLMATSIQMLVGGSVLLLAGIVAGETRGLNVASVSNKSLLALVYLIIFGSIVGYTAYTWLLRHAPPALVSTYAYVNPVVAVLLGWAFAGESVTEWTLISSAIIISSVAIITLSKRKPATPEPSAEQPLAVSSPGESYAGASRG